MKSLRRLKRHSEAIGVYGRAMALTDKPVEKDTTSAAWLLFNTDSNQRQKLA